MSTHNKCLVFIHIVNVKPSVPTKANRGSIDINYELCEFYSFDKV